MHINTLKYLFLVSLILPTCVFQFLPFSGPCDVQPGWGGESGGHRHQPAAPAGQRHPEQRRAAESNQKGTQVSHPTPTTYSQQIHLRLSQIYSHTLLCNIWHHSKQWDFRFVFLLYFVQASVSSLSVSIFPPPETVWGEAASWRPRGDWCSAGWGRGSYVSLIETSLFLFPLLLE